MSGSPETYYHDDAPVNASVGEASFTIPTALMGGLAVLAVCIITEWWFHGRHAARRARERERGDGW